MKTSPIIAALLALGWASSSHAAPTETPSTEATPAPAPAEPENDADAPIDPALAEMLDEPIVSTASKRSEKVSAAPATVFTITAEEMRVHGIRTVEEAMNYLGNSVTAQAPYGEVGARGLLLSGDGGNHVLMLVNGHAINDEWGGWAPVDRELGVPIELIDHIEISLGPGSVLYGTSAMFGVVNVVTRDPYQHEGVHASARGAIAPPVGPNGQMRTAGDGYRVGHEARVSAGYGRAFRRTRRGGGFSFQVEAFDLTAPSTNFGPQTATYEPGPNVRVPGVWGGPARRASRGVAGMASLHLGNFEIDLMSMGHRTRWPLHMLRLLTTFSSGRSAVSRLHSQQRTLKRCV